MIPSKLFSNLTNEGFVQINNVIDSYTVQEIRHQLRILFEEKKIKRKGKITRFLSPNDIIENKLLIDTIFNIRVINTLKNGLAEDFFMIPDFMVQKNMFGNYGKYGGWHVDSNSEGSSKHLFDNDYRFVKCGIFLQDNTSSWGGGIDYLPQGHLFPQKTGDFQKDMRTKNRDNMSKLRSHSKTLYNKAGDFIAFDSRLPHASTEPKSLKEPDFKNNFVKNFPSNHDKYVIYWNACNKKTYADLFMIHTFNRCQQYEIEKENNPNNEYFFCEYLKRKFQQDYPSFFIQKVLENKINIPTLNEKLLAKLKAYNFKYDQ